MMLFKFYIVASIFMHLKWDSKLLTGVFYFGLGLAVIVYLIMLTTFRYWAA
jgi:cytochrome c oxidase subunit 4